MQDFAGLPAEYSNYKDSKIVILPIPYDKTSTYIKGADKGPQALLEASTQLETYDIETNSEVYKSGIFTEDPLKSEDTPKKLTEQIKSKVSQLLENNKFVTIIGGEHTVTIGSVQAHKKKYPNLSVLQLDAHADLRDSYKDSKYNHACVMARVKELCPFTQVGIRSMDSKEKESTKHIYYAKDIHDNDDWMDKAISHLSDSVYLTLDLDVLDPSIMPATGTPEPGGLTYYQILKFLKKVSESKNIVGFDIVELCPNENSKPSNFLAAKLLYKILTYINPKDS
tara:strand:- start:1029 stop:1874 length:846 start_codon:yes stop_codon:yes gene_type:complete